MELKHLQALMGIADTGSFSAAAASIGTVQSNVSAHVARLERELDVQLVDRASGRLTEEGEVVIERARRVMNELEAMVADVTALRAGGGRHRPARHDRHDRALAGPPALRPPPGAPPPHPPERGRGLERPARAAAGLGPARPGGGHLPPQRRRDHGGAALRRGPGARAPVGPPAGHRALAPPRAPLGARAAASGAGHGAAGRDRQRHGPGPGRAATGHGARRRPADRLAGLRRLRAGHPPGHRRAGPPARPVLGAAGHRPPPPPGRRGAAPPGPALGARCGP